MSKTKIKQSSARLSLATHGFSGARLFYFQNFSYAALQVKIAAAKANKDAGVIDKTKASKIIKACESLKKKVGDAKLFYADVYQGGGGIGVHLNLNETIAEEAELSGDPKTHISAGQSTADVCATAIRMALWRTGQSLLSEMQGLTTSIGYLVDNAKDQHFMARTCLQDAMPTRYSTYFGAWRSACERTHAEIGELLDRLLIVNLGATVIGSGEGAHETYRRNVMGYLCEESTLRLSRRSDLFDAAQFADDILNLSSALVCLGQIISKIARDIRLLSSGPKHGFADITIPKIINGSAFFNDKNNPTVAETLMQAVWLVEGKHHSICLANGHAELNLNVFEPMMGFLVYESLESMTQILQHFRTHCISGISPKIKG